MKLETVFPRRGDAPDFPREVDAPLAMERRGQRQMEEVARAVRGTPWVVTLLQLAWTAGPVTLLAAIGGYFLGYGTAPTRSYLIFFFAYSVIAGLVGIGARLLYNALSARRRREAQRDLALVNDLLPDIGFAIRDLLLEAMEADLRRQAAAGMLLRHLDLAPGAVEVAVADLTGRTELAVAAKHAEVYRRAGLQTRVREVVAEVSACAQEALAELGSVAPDLAPLLRDRLEGRSPEPEYGIPREEGFIERVLAAADREDEALMTLRDALEMLVLTFELLNGREIPILSFEYRGGWELARATDDLEARHNRYRLAKLKGVSRLKALVTVLGASEIAESQPLAPPGLSAETLLNTARRDIHALCERAERLGLLLSLGRAEHAPELRRHLAVLRRVMRLSDAMRRAFTEAGRRHLLFLRTLEAWQRLAAKEGSGEEIRLIGPRARGLRLRERRLALENKDKLELAGKLARHLRDEGVRFRDGGVICGRPGRERPFQDALARDLAIQAAAELDDVVDLGAPEIQRAVYASHAANLTGLEPGGSAQSKVGIGAAMIGEVEDRLPSLAEGLAARLVLYYGVTLDKGAIDFLHEQYGARRERLEMLAARKVREGRSPAELATTITPTDLTRDPDWESAMERVRAVLDRYGRSV